MKQFGLTVIVLALAALFYLTRVGTEVVDSAPGWQIVSETVGTDGAAYDSMVFFDKNNGFALAVSTLRTTSDGGHTWRIASNFRNKALNSIVFTGEHSGWMIADEWARDGEEKNKPSILRTNNRGRDWQEVSFAEENSRSAVEKFSRLNSICFDGKGKVWLAGDNGILGAVYSNTALKVVDTNKTKAEILRVICGKNDFVWAAGKNGVFAFYYQDKWNFHELGESRSFTNIAITGDSVWLVGSSMEPIQESTKSIVRGLLLRSRDSGLTWEDKSPSNANGLVDVAFDGAIGWAVGLNGAIFSTVDNGDNWRIEKSPTKSSLVDIFILDSQNAWISGDGGIILKFIMR